MEFTPHTERRKHPRFQVQSLVMAVPSNADLQIARVVNISKGGMAVRYINQDQWLAEAGQIDIFVNSDFFMTGIPVEGVHDSRVDHNSSFSLIAERQCNLQFGSLSPAQENLLDEFIRRHTAGHA